jgi:miniconductance mechanosensitive channel
MLKISDFDFHSLLDPSYIEMCIGIGVLLMAAMFANFVVKRTLLKGLEHLLRHTAFGRDQELRKHGVIKRLANTMPLFVISIGVKIIPDIPTGIAEAISRTTHAAMLITLALAASGLLSILDVIYHRRTDRRTNSAKGYFQLGKIGIMAITTILVIAALTGKSPVILLGSLGAMAAVLTLVFQDTLLSFVASLQISSNDVVRVGDWISMPSVNADGDVIEIGLHTVKVRNWNNTITTIPTRRLATDSFANWRGMQESGGRRIKRAIHIDQYSLRFLDAGDIAEFSKLTLLREYLSRKNEEIETWNSALGNQAHTSANTRRQTNIGLFRAYLDAYLRAHPHINPDMTLMVRQLEPTSKGIPLEIYCFTNTVVWADYEGIQSDIFDHIMTIMPLFGLAPYQDLAGQDLRQGRSVTHLAAE